MAGALPDLEYIDEYGIAIRAEPDAVYDATVAVLRTLAGPSLRRYARLVGSAYATTSGTGELEQGDTVVGFRVASSERPHLIRLEGAHRFAAYRLGLRIDRGQDDRVILRARTDAVFPGRAGRIYRAVVIGSRGHRFVVRRMLRRIARRALGGR
jgi:hypothetical protein